MTDITLNLDGRRNSPHRGWRKPTLKFTPLPHMEEFLEELTARELSPDYVRVVRQALVHFADYLHSEGVKHPAEITRQHIIRFQALASEWAPSTRFQRMQYVRSWIAWCAEIGYIVDNPWVAIKVQAVRKKPKPLEDDEVELLFATHRQGAFTMSPFTYHRREVMLALFYAWGLRIHELEALNVTNMDVRQDYVRCINKGGGTKMMPYTDELKKVVQRWLSNRVRHAVPGEDALLITSTGERMYRSHIYKDIVDLGTRAGIRINPHRLRDTCGTHLLDSDVPVERVSKILGHTNIKRTLQYSRVNDHKVKESLEAAMDPRLARLFTTQHVRRTSDLQDEDD